jgi:tetraacyldisaccharide 4'-kinase
MRHWRSLNAISILFLPVAGLFWLTVVLRRWLYTHGWLSSFQVGVPVVVVGNITSGGTGKTPLVIALVKALQHWGFRPGVVSRGYGGAGAGPQLVTQESDPSRVGDESVLIAWKSGAPVAIGRDRVAAARLLLARNPGLDLIVSDDGLQHYRLRRQVELALVDGAYGLGNGLPIPAGPLREPAARLHEVDAVLVTRRSGQVQRIKLNCRRMFDVPHGPGFLYRLLDRAERRPLDCTFGGKIVAIAGIAHPEGFFGLLREAGLDILPHPFPDHHNFTVGDVPEAGTVLMTEKDAVKCRKFARREWWALEWDAQPAQELIAWLVQAIKEPSQKHGSARYGTWLRES